MSDAAVFRATFVNQRPVAGRKVHQFVFEVPIEQANTALMALGGLPDPANPVWVAVARIDPKATEPVKSLPAPEKERKKWEEMKPSQQAAIRCNEPEFRRFLGERIANTRKWEPPADEEEAAMIVRYVCNVESRKDLNTHSGAAETWAQLDNEYFAWQRGYR